MAWICVCGTGPHDRYRNIDDAIQCARCKRPRDAVVVPVSDLCESPAPRGPAVAHYNQSPIQPIEFIMANDISHCEACVIKYVVRWRKKNGVADLKKARDYIDFLINQAEKGSPL